MTIPDGLTLALLDHLPDALAVVDAREPGLPVVLVNQALAQLRQQSAEELRARGFAALFGEPGGGPRSVEVATHIARGESCSLRVSLPAGPSSLSADIRAEPLRDASGTVTHYAFFHAPLAPPAVPAVTPDAEVAVPRPPLQRDDRLTGLRHIEYFHEIYRRDFAIAQREGRSLAIFACDIDALGVYNDTFGRLAADSVIRRVGRALASALRRASDLVARVDGGRFVALSVGLDAAAARRHAETLAARVRELRLHHPRSPVARFVTVSIGVGQFVPQPESTPEDLLKAAQRALETARAAGRNRVAVDESIG